MTMDVISVEFKDSVFQAKIDTQATMQATMGIMSCNKR